MTQRDRDFIRFYGKVLLYIILPALIILWLCSCTPHSAPVKGTDRMRVLNK